MGFVGWIVLAAAIGCLLGFVIADISDSVDECEDIFEEGDEFNVKKF